MGKNAGRNGKCFRYSVDHEVQDCSWLKDIVYKFLQEIRLY